MTFIYLLYMQTTNKVLPSGINGNSTILTTYLNHSIGQTLSNLFLLHNNQKDYSSTDCSSPPQARPKANLF